MIVTIQMKPFWYNFYKVLSIFCVCEFFTSNAIRLEVETENNIPKMWFNFDPIPRNSNPGTG